MSARRSDEFPEGASVLDDASRRTLLKLMGASLGLAGLTACSRPVENILPASRGVEDQIPGNPLFYATAMTLGGTATGLLVEAHDGRPTKVEGNPDHPFSRGAASAFHQASILGLYDPDRSREVVHEGQASTWEEFAAFVNERFREPGRLRFLSQTVNSPSLEALRAHALAGFPRAKWVEYEPISDDEALAGAELAFGQTVQPIYRFEHADTILSLDSDFLALDSPTLTYTTDFAARRRVASGKDSMNRLYVVESQFSVTGAMADHRLRMRAGDIADFAADLARELGLFPAGLVVLNQDPRRKWLAAVARDLKRSAGRSLVIAGPRQPAAVHAAAHWINHALGNAGKTVSYTATARRPQVPALKELAAEMAAGQVETLVILGGNPAYDAPADLEFGAAMRKVPVTVHVGVERNETGVLATWHVPEAHYLESWGDARAVDGTASIQQPLIQPLYGGRTIAEVVALLSANNDQRAYDIVRSYWLARWPAAHGEKMWRQCLHDGSIRDTADPAIAPMPRAKEIAAALAAARPTPGIEVTFHPSASTWDGRFANNGWLQEAPDPMTKLTWDNAALLSPATARHLGVSNGDTILIAAAGAGIEMPVWIQPGHAEQSISLALGYGRTVCGRVGHGAGQNTYRLRTTSALHRIGGVTVTKTGRTYKLATTQAHNSMEGRPLVREAAIEDYRRQPAFAKKPDEKTHLFQLFPRFSYDQGNQWGMAIDLNSCIGCNACVLACQAENNIPIVGKEQVLRGREMHWIRLDRYYGGEDDARAVTQPVACQQCENAPCESVCPVAATSHSPEGLNDMVYNRCVGTRYCANNCPYKVRRFNFLDYHKEIQETEKMAFNPDVTVRMRGVMEKCTYCVQRIQEKKIQAQAEGRRALRDGEILTACQQTCPTNAIVFGNINDPSSRVSQLKKQSRDYTILTELNTRPRTSYLAKLRNPNPELG
jgi:molybdopterin-containing oxidoreductase family iron-sulfur binding subunit